MAWVSRGRASSRFAVSPFTLRRFIFFSLFIYLFFFPLPSKMLKLQFTAVEVPGIGGLRRSGQLALIKQAAASHKLLLVDTSTAAQTLKKAL